LQPTALVKEALQNMLGASIEWKDRTHIYALSARMMRRILVNQSNTKGAAKRGGGAMRVTLHDSMATSDEHNDAEILELDRSLNELAEFDARKAEVLELHYFAGLTFAELADVMNLSESSVHQDLRTAKAWLRNRLS
jgi:RNA polymerase sigma factor (TIGR02999 family)